MYVIYVYMCVYDVCMYMYVCMSVILNPYEVVCDTAPVLETKMNSLLLDFEKSGALAENKELSWEKNPVLWTSKSP